MRLHDPAGRARHVMLAQDIGISGLPSHGGYFQQNVFPVPRSGRPGRLGSRRDAIVEIPEAARARAAAYVISMRRRALAFRSPAPAAVDFDPAVRDRLLAGAMIPAVVVDRARNSAAGIGTCAGTLRISRRHHRAGSAVHGAAARPKDLGARWCRDSGAAHIGIHTQPISFIGLPVVAVPVPLEPMPIGVQIIAAPWREDIALRVAYALERSGVVSAPPPRGL